MGVLVSNHDFTHGELAPTLYAQSALRLYNKCAAKLENFLILPGGAARTRFGTITQFNLSALPVGATHFQLFSWDTGLHKYLVIIGDVGGIKVLEVSTGTVTSITSPFPASAVEKREIKSGQSGSDIIFVHASTQPKTLTSNSTTGVVTGGDFVFKNPPNMSFDDNYDNTVFNLGSTSVTPGNVSDGGCPGLTITTMGNFGGFDASFVGGTFSALGTSTGQTIGQGRIVALHSSTHVQIRISAAFGQANNIGSAGVDLRASAYNSTYGWPACVAFYEDRMVFAGGSADQVRETVFFSRLNAYRDYDPGTGEATDGFGSLLGSNKSDNILNLVSGRSFQVYTQTAEYATPIVAYQRLSPGTVNLRLQTSKGSTITTPIVLDDSTAYVRRGGRAIMGFTGGVASYSYSSSDVSTISSHLIQNPVDMAAFLADEAYDANLAMVINEDGSMIFQQTLQEEAVSAWTSGSTYGDDKWLNVSVLDNEVYFITERDGQPSLEQLDWTVSMDCAQSVTLAAGIQIVQLSGPYYNSREVSIVTGVGADIQHPSGSYIGTVTSNATGQVTFEAPQAGEYYFGFKFDRNLTTLPAHVLTPNGDTLYLKKRISKVFIQYYDAYPFRVNGMEVPLYHEVTLNQPNPPKSGIYATTVNKTGWDRTADVEISMDYPLPLTILGITARVSI